MIAVVQRVTQSVVTVDNQPVGSIGKGLVVLLGITHNDSQKTIDWLCKKIVNLRIFSDPEDKMNLSVKDVQGEILLVSQFTLHANTKKGNRPSFQEAAPPTIAIPLYEKFIQTLELELDKPIQTGEFGAMMQVSLINDGPVTIIIDTEKYGVL